MGLSTALGLAEIGGDMALRAHLHSNCHPPMGVMFEAAKQALEIANAAEPCDSGFLFEDILDETAITLPDGWTLHGRQEVTAREVMLNLHLAPFINFGDGDSVEVGD